MKNQLEIGLNYKLYEKKLADTFSKISKKCVCGHTNHIPSYKKKTICSWCGRTVYKSDLEKFKEKLKIEIRKVSKNENYKCKS